MGGSIGYVWPIIALLTAGLFAGFAAGLFGIGGGFVVVPALIATLPLLGGDASELAHVAIATSLATIIITSLRSVFAHARRGAVDFQTIKVWSPWIVMGVGIGIVIAARIPGTVLAFIFGVGVIIMAVHFLFPFLSRKTIGNQMPRGGLRVAIAGSVGAFSAMLGIGGGTIVTIVMTLCGRTIHNAIATAAGFGCVIAIPGMIGFMIIGWGQPGLPFGSLGYVNIPAAVAITSTSILTAPLGVAVAHRLNQAMLKRVFGIYLIFVGILMIRNALSLQPLI